MTDALDRAQQFEALRRDLELRAAAEQTARLAAPAGAEICVDCDATIPVQRRAAVPGCRRCAPCQSAVERRTHVPVRPPC